MKTVIGGWWRDATELQGLGIATVAICSNDPVPIRRQFDTHENLAKQHGFYLPYLHDEPGSRPSYDAVCTPDFSVSTASWNSSIGAGLIESKHPIVPNARARTL